MLSFKALIPKRSRHIASIEDVEGETKEIVFFTEIARGEKIPTNNFEEELKKYTEEGSTVEDFKLKDEYRFNIIPSNTITGFQRETVAILGQNGSGKSWQIKNYIRNYSLLRPGNKIFFYSLNKLENDPTYDKDLLEKITQIDLMSVDCAILPEKFQDSLIIFDDVLDVKFSLSPAEVYGLEYQQADLTKKKKLADVCDKKSTSIKTFLNESLVNVINLGRKYNVSCISVFHKLKSGVDSTFAVEQSSSCWLYPYVESKQTLCGFLFDRLSFSREDVKEFSKEKFYQYDFLYINRGGKLFYFTPNHFKFI